MSARPEQPDDQLAGVEETIRHWGLRAPALLAMEVGKPVAFLGAQMLYVANPILRLLDRLRGGGLAGRADALADLLENPAAYAQLSDLLADEQPGGDPR